MLPAFYHPAFLYRIFIFAKPIAFFQTTWYNSQSYTESFQIENLTADIWRRIEVVITGLTRNRVGSPSTLPPKTAVSWVFPPYCCSAQTGNANKLLTFLLFYIFSSFLETYRSGHNENDSKSFDRWWADPWVRIPPSPYFQVLLIWQDFSFPVPTAWNAVGNQGLGHDAPVWSGAKPRNPFLTA